MIVSVLIILQAACPAFADEADYVIPEQGIKVLLVKANGNVEMPDFDQQPVISNDRTLVPMRAIFESLGAAVKWDDETKTVTASYGQIDIVITIGENTLYKYTNNQGNSSYHLDAPARIINGRTMVPVRAIVESFDSYYVYWYDSSYTVMCMSKYADFTDEKTINYLKENGYDDTTISKLREIKSQLSSMDNEPDPSYDYDNYDESSDSDDYYEYPDENNDEIFGEEEPTSLPSAELLHDGEYFQHVDGETVGMCTIKNSTGESADIWIEHLRMHGLEYHIQTAYLQDDGTFVAYGDLSGTHNKTGEYEYEDLKFVITVLDYERIKVDIYDAETLEHQETIIYDD